MGGILMFFSDCGEVIDRFFVFLHDSFVCWNGGEEYMDNYKQVTHENKES